MSSNYPASLDALTNPTATDVLNSTTVPHHQQHTDANDAIEAIEGTLGTNPQGSAATVGARLVALDATVAAKAPASGIAPSAITGTAAVLGANTFTGKQTLPASTTSAASLNLTNGTAPTSPATGDLWAASGSLIYQSSFGGQTLAFLSSNITGTAASITGNITPSQVTGTAVVTADTRLSDTRTPTDASVTFAKIVAPVDGSTVGVGSVYFVTNPASSAGTGQTMTAGLYCDTTAKKFVWVIQHNVGRWPLAVTVLNNDGSSVNPASLGFAAGFPLASGSTVSRTSGSSTVTVTANGHGLSNGDVVAVTGTSTPGISGTFAIANVTTNSFSYTSGATTAVSTLVVKLQGKLPTYVTVSWGAAAATTLSANQYKVVFLG